MTRIGWSVSAAIVGSQIVDVMARPWSSSTGLP